MNNFNFLILILEVRFFLFFKGILILIKEGLSSVVGVVFFLLWELLFFFNFFESISTLLNELLIILVQVLIQPLPPQPLPLYMYLTLQLILNDKTILLKHILIFLFLLNLLLHFHINKYK